MKQIWWSVTFLMCIPFFFAAKRNQSRHKTMYDRWAGVGESQPSSMKKFHSSNSPFYYASGKPFWWPDDDSFANITVFLPVGSPCALWTSVLGLSMLEKRLSRSKGKERNFFANKLLCSKADLLRSMWSLPHAWGQELVEIQNRATEMRKCTQQSQLQCSFYSQGSSFTKIIYARERKIFQLSFLHVLPKGDSSWGPAGSKMAPASLPPSSRVAGEN